MWTSSQSSTAARSGPVDDQVAHPEIAVHQPRRRRRWPVGGQPPKRPLECRCGVAHLVEAGAPLRELVGRRPGRSVRIGAVDRGQRLRALPQQPARPASSGRAGCAARSSRRRSRRRSGTDCPAPQANSAARMCGTGAPAAAARLDAGLQFHARVHVVGRAGAQDQRACAPSVTTASNAQVVRLAPPVSAAGSRCSRRRAPAAGPSASRASFTCGRNRRSAAPPGGSGSPRRPR